MFSVFVFVCLAGLIMEVDAGRYGAEDKMLQYCHLTSGDSGDTGRAG